MSMDIGTLMNVRVNNQVSRGNTKGTGKNEESSFSKIFQTIPNQSVEGKLANSDLASMLVQLQQIITRLQLHDQPIQGLNEKNANEKLSELLNGLPDELQKNIEEILDSATTFGDLLQGVKRELNEVNLLAIAIMIAGQNNQILQQDKHGGKLPSWGIVERQFVSQHKAILNDKDRSEMQSKELKRMIDVLQQQLSQPKSTKVEQTTDLKKMVQSLSLNAKSQVGMKLDNLSQNIDIANKPVNEQLISNMQFPLSQHAQYKLHVTPEKVANNQFVQELQSIIQSGKLLTLKNGESQFQIKLFPEHLGRLDITIIQKQGELLARITASTLATKELIESQLHQLKHAFQGQNIQLDKIEIQHQRFESFYQEQQQNSRDDNERQQRENNNQFTKENDSESESESFASLLNEMNAVV